MKNLTKILLISGILLMTAISWISCTNGNATSSLPVIAKPLTTNTLADTKANMVKKQALTQVISALEDDMVAYNWLEGESCNVGILAQYITKSTYTEIKERRNKEYAAWIHEVTTLDPADPRSSASWKNLIGYYCGITGRPMSGIIGELNKAGFSNKEIVDLEYLKNPRYIYVGHIDTKVNNYWSIKSNLIAYLKAWLSDI